MQMRGLFSMSGNMGMHRKVKGRELLLLNLQYGCAEKMRTGNWVEPR